MLAQQFRSLTVNLATFSETFTVVKVITRPAYRKNVLIDESTSHAILRIWLTDVLLTLCLMTTLRNRVKIEKKGGLHRTLYAL